MQDITSKYGLSFKDGLYYKKDGSPYEKSNHCNAVRGKLQGGGYKVTIVPVDGGHAMRVLPLKPSTAKRPTNENSTTKQPEQGKEVLVEDLAKKVAELEAKLAQQGGNGTEPKVTRGNAPSGRPKRRPFKRNRLAFPERPGFVRRVVNDVEDGMRVAQFKQAGWTEVTDPFAGVDSDGDLSQPSNIGSAVSRHVGVDNAGRSTKGVLMEIPEEYYKEDQEAKQELVDRTERGLRRVDKDGVTGGIEATGYESEVNRRI